LAAIACSGSTVEDKVLMLLTPADAGHEVVIQLAKRFEVALPEISTSGYIWAVHQADPAYLKLEQEMYPAPETDHARVGANRTKLFVFRVLKEGQAKLELWLRRPWDEADKHIEAFEVTLKIQSH
jgi:predicted secreted protein